MPEATDVKTLRNRTGAGILDCKEALDEVDGDLDEAADYLRKQGVEEAEGKSAQTAEGKIGSYIHMGGSIGVLVEVNCQTDFVANTDEFNQFVEEVAMQIAAQNPSYVSRDEISESEIENEKDVISEQVDDLDEKPEDVQDQILDGKLESDFYQEQVLLDQDYIRDSDKTIEDLLNETVAEIDENINIRRFERFEVGEGIEVEEEDFAQEVAEEIS